MNAIGNERIEALDDYWRITRNGILGKVKFKDMTEKEQDEIQGRTYHLLWEGEIVLVPEAYLLSYEQKAFRTAELASEFRLRELQEDIEQTVKHLAYLNMEYAHRIERNNKLTPEEAQQLKVLLVKSSQLDRAEIPCEDFSHDDMKRMEALYVRTLPFATLTPEQELDARERLQKSAEDAFKNGFTFVQSTGEVGEYANDGEKYKVEFATLQEAQEFFGLIESTEGESEEQS